MTETGRRYLSGVNCTPELAQKSFMATKNLYGKADGIFFYQYVQSFSPKEEVTPGEAHQIAQELAERFFPGCEVLVATHMDTEHLHSHLIVNSVHPDTGKKLHFTPNTLEQMRKVSDQICMEHGLTTLKPYQQDRRTQGLRTGEYRAANRGDSWKFQLIIAMGIGTIISKLLSMTGMTFPIYIGAMIAAAFMRNIGEYSGQFTIYMGEINDIGGISLSLFLGIAMITLKLWQLADLALPLITLLAGQTILMFLFTYFVIFNIMGRDYDAAVLSSGVCGFGMGATPNAMANMQAICERYVPSVKAYLLVPLIGSLFADFLNSLVITFFINFL